MSFFGLPNSCMPLYVNPTCYSTNESLSSDVTPIRFRKLFALEVTFEGLIIVEVGRSQVRGVWWVGVLKFQVLLLLACSGGDRDSARGSPPFFFVTFLGCDCERSKLLCVYVTLSASHPETPSRAPREAQHSIARPLPHYFPSS